MKADNKLTLYLKDQVHTARLIRDSDGCNYVIRDYQRNTTVRVGQLPLRLVELADKILDLKQFRQAEEHAQVIINYLRNLL